MFSAHISKSETPNVGATTLLMRPWLRGMLCGDSVGLWYVMVVIFALVSFSVQCCSTGSSQGREAFINVSILFWDSQTQLEKEKNVLHVSRAKVKSSTF